MLVPRAYPVLLGFAQTAVRSLFIANCTDAALLSTAARAGLDVTNDAFGFAARDAGAIRDEATFRVERIAATPAFQTALAALPETERDAMVRSFADFATTAFQEEIALIDVLDDLAQRTDIRGAIVTEDASPAAQTLVRWARARGIPSVMLHHGATRHFLFMPDMLVDDHYLYGRHAVPTVLDAGVRPDQVHLGTFYGHLEHTAPAPGAGPRFRARFGIPSERVVVVLALGFNAFLSTLEPPHPWFFALTISFLRAVKLLRDRGIGCSVVIKHRWTDAALETATRALARDVGLEDIAFFDGPMSEILPATDVLCGTESNTLIEAMLYDVALVDVAYPWHWLVGPYFAADDGLPYADARDPEGLAATLEPLLARSAERERQVERHRELRQRFVHDPFRNVDDIARDLLDILERRRASLHRQDGPEHSAPIDSIRAIPAGARRVLDLTGAEESPALIRALHAGLSVGRDPAGLHDVVVLGYALARSETPEALLAAARASLAPHGCVIAEFTNARNLRAIRNLLEDRPWSARAVGRDPSAAARSLSDVLALFAAHGFRTEAVHVHDDPGLAAIDPNLSGTFSLGPLTIDAVRAEGMREFKALSYTIVARPA